MSDEGPKKDDADSLEGFYDRFGRHRWFELMLPREFNGFENESDDISDLFDDPAEDAEDCDHEC